MSVPTRIIELLGSEGGWWTVDQLCGRLDAPLPSVRRSVYRLRDRGLLRSRETFKSGKWIREVGRGKWSRYEPGQRIDVDWTTPVNEWSLA